jgi:hypothetical protein
MSAHTPGPWVVDGASLIWSPTGRAAVAAVSAPRETRIVQYRRLSVQCADFDEACANARLIAASPDTTNALHRAYIVLRDVHLNWPRRDSLEGQRLLCNMRDAIADAYGLDRQNVQDGPLKATGSQA